MTNTIKGVKKSVTFRRTDQRYCFFYDQDPQAEHQKTQTPVTSASSALPSSSEQFSMEDNKAEIFVFFL